MIGVIPQHNEKEVVVEFFELFKTPWEFYRDREKYDCVIVCEDRIFQTIDSQIILVFSSEETSLERPESHSLNEKSERGMFNLSGFDLPLYQPFSTFKNVSGETVFLKSEAGIVGLKVEDAGKTIFRVGYDLFKEISFLLKCGQPVENAIIPVLENHVALLRECLLRAGLRFLEIPPAPFGYDFVVCLTHDVDFIKISNHLMDHSMWGFVGRALFNSIKRFLSRDMTFARILQNWKAVIVLPFI